MDCIFCKIANGEIPCKKIYEDELVMAFLDLSPHTNGHTLIIPKKHHTNILDMDNNLLAHIQETAKKLFELYKEKLYAAGITLVQNNEYGQEIKHYHLHLIPRYKKDGISVSHTKNGIKDLNEVYEMITK